MDGKAKLPNINSVCIAGRLTRDVELKYLPSGTAVAEFGIAYDKPRKKADGSWGKVAFFFEVQVWDKTAETCAETLTKGCPVVVDGSLELDQWEKDGQKRSKTRIVARRVQRLDWPDDDAPTGSTESPAEPEQEDDVPF